MKKLVFVFVLFFSSIANAEVIIHCKFNNVTSFHIPYSKVYAYHIGHVYKGGIPPNKLYISNKYYLRDKWKFITEEYEMDQTGKKTEPRYFLGRSKIRVKCDIR